MDGRRAYLYLAQTWAGAVSRQTLPEQRAVRGALWRLLRDVRLQVACSAGDPRSVAILRAATFPWRYREELVTEWAHEPLATGTPASQPRLEAARTLAVKLGMAFPSRPVIVAVAVCDLPLDELDEVRPRPRAQLLPGDVVAVSLSLSDDDEPLVLRADLIPRPTAEPKKRGLRRGARAGR